jgi:hypothetical protein
MTSSVPTRYEPPRIEDRAPIPLGMGEIQPSAVPSP